MRSHADDFIAFAMTEEGDAMDQQQFMQYCDTLETGDDWGGQVG